MFCKFSPTHLPSLMYFSSCPLLRFRHVSRLLIHTTENLSKRLSPCHPANSLIKWNPNSSAPPAISWRTPVVDLPPWVNPCHHRPSWNLEILPVFVSLMTLWLTSVWELCDARDQLPTITDEASSSSSSESKQWICKTSLLNEGVNRHIFAQPAFSNALHSFFWTFILTHNCSAFLFLRPPIPIPTSFVAIQLLSRGWLFATPWTTAHQAPLSSTISRSLLRIMSMESVTPFNHCILCRPFLSISYSTCLTLITCFSECSLYLHSIPRSYASSLSSKELAAFLNQGGLLQSLTFSRGAVNTLGPITLDLILYLFIWLQQALVASSKLLVTVCGI